MVMKHHPPLADTLGTPDPHDLITEAHHQVAGIMSLVGEAEELQPMRGADLYFLLKAIDERIQGALRLLERFPSPVP